MSLKCTAGALSWNSLKTATFQPAKWKSIRTYASSTEHGQGLTLVHFSAHRERFLWDRGCIWGCLGAVQEVRGGIRGCLDRILCQKRLRLS